MAHFMARLRQLLQAAGADLEEEEEEEQVQFVIYCGFSQ